MKSILIIFLMLLCISSLNAQTECSLTIEYTADDVLPPSYTFKISPQTDVAQYYWSFGDNTISDSPSPKHSFIFTDTYVIQVKIINPDGSECYGKLEASFEGSTTSVNILTGKGKVMESTVSGCGLIISTDNGYILTPSENVPEFTLKPGQYVELAYELLDKASECGKVAKIHRITEIVQVCNVPIEYTKTDKVGVYKFQTSEQPVWTTFKWYFSDKTNSDSPTPVHEFQTSGSYVVELLVTKPDGTKCNGRIEARFEGVTTPVLSAKGKVHKLNVTGCDFVITLENGINLIPAKMNTDFLLMENQYVEITYEKLAEKITNCNEGVEVNIFTIKEILITPDCKAYFTASSITDAATNTKTVEFINESIGEIRECVWNFGDNTTSYSTSKTLTHEYTNPGEYKVCLIIATTSGCKSDYCTTVKIGPTTDCNIDLVFKPKEESTNTFLFEAISSVEIVGYKWYFGDGTYSDTKNPEHTYEITGTYEITCTVLTSSGCISTRSVKISVIIPSLPNCKGAVNLLLFDPTDDKCNGKAIVKLLNENAVEIENVKYIWSDGQTGSVLENLCPDKNYTIKSLIEGVCQKYTSFTMLSKPIWHATSFNGVNNFSVIEPKEGIEYEWDFGNGVKLKGAEINYDFEKDGIYEVKLTAISGNDFAEFSQQVVVLKSITGSNIINSSEIRIFPNPFKNVLNISLGNPVERELNIEILSLTGQKVLSELLPFMEFNKREIDVQSLKQGIYFLRITNGSMLIAERKIIKAY